MRQIPLVRSFVRAGNDRIYFESAGIGAPLVFCHGASGNHATWFKQVNYFSVARQVITWDHRGFGLSTMEDGVSRPSVAVTDLLRVLDTLQLEKVDLVGQSMGGWTALRLALSYPDRVRSLILTCTTGGVKTPAILASWNDLMDRLRAGAFPSLLGVDAALSKAFIKNSPMEACAYQAFGGFNSALPSSIFAPMEEEMNECPAIHALKIPVFAIAGEEDTIFPPEIMWEAARQFPLAQTYQINGAGHSAFFEAAESWNARVETFLEELH